MLFIRVNQSNTHVVYWDIPKFVYVPAFNVAYADNETTQLHASVLLIQTNKYHLQISATQPIYFCFDVLYILTY